MNIPTRMKVKISNKQRQEFPQQLLIQAVRYFAGMSMGEDNANLTKIDLNIKPKTSNQSSNCSSVYGAVNETTINVYVGTDDLYSLLVVLAHEVIHHAQRCSGRLQYISDDPLTYFDGIGYDKTIVKWEDRPWENEACLYQSKLTDELIVYLDQHKLTRKLLESLNAIDKQYAYMVHDDLKHAI